MLDNELREQKDKNTRKYRRLGIGLIATSAVLMIILVIMQWLSSPSLSPSSSFPETASDDTKTNMNQALLNEEDNPLREQFKRELIELEQQLKLFKINAGLADWNSSRYQQIIETKTKALNTFATGFYKQALQQLGVASLQAKKLKSDWNLAFNIHLQSARNFFNQDDHVRAKWQINLALKIKPDNEKALALQSRIDVLPEIKQLLAEAEIADVENNRQQQAKIIRKILQLDPARQNLTNVLTKIETDLKEKKFTAAINKGISAADKGQLRLARKELKKAKDIYANRHEVTVLAQKIKKKNNDVALAQFLKQINQLVSEDKWQQLQQVLKASAGRYDDHPRTEYVRRLTTRVLKFEKDVAVFLDRPDRLEDKKIKAYAQALLNHGKQIEQFSPKVNVQLRQLEELLRQYAVLVDVTLHSDAKTDIFLIGKRHLGKSKLFRLQLKPGSYVFEGERKGFRSRRINLSIQPNATAKEITVICNERI